MNAKVAMATAAGLVAGIALSACIVDREGAPCTTDDNCPRSQYCDGALPQHACRELTPQLDAGVACPLIFEAVTQLVSACASGDSALWSTEIGVSTICNTFSTGLAAGRQTYDAMELKNCRRAIRATTCSTLGSRTPGQILEDCDVFSGTVGTGSACATTKDCAAGAWCDTTAGCMGTCKAYVPVGSGCLATDLCTPGAACSGAPTGTCLPLLTSGPCDAGLCNAFTHACDGTGQCVAKAATGVSGCDQNGFGGAGNVCQPNLNCVGAIFGAKVCQAGAPVDTACQPLTNTCERFTVCMARDGGNFCTPTPNAGGQCGLPAGAQDGVTCRQSRCVLPLLSLVGTCSNFVASGAACTNGAEESSIGRNSQCGRLARCVSGTCRTDFCP